MTITIEDFKKVELRVGKISSVDDIPGARNPMFKLAIDFGSTTKQCVGGIKGTYSKEALLGKTVVAVVNLEPKSVAGVASECMLLAAFNDDGLSLLVPEKAMPPGTLVG